MQMKALVTTANLALRVYATKEKTLIIEAVNVNILGVFEQQD